MQSKSDNVFKGKRGWSATMAACALTLQPTSRITTFLYVLTAKDRAHMPASWPKAVNKVKSKIRRWTDFTTFFPTINKDAFLCM